MESILVLEDDEDLREIVSAVLEEQDYSVTSTSSASQALEMAAKHSFHLILSDVRMAGSLDGVAVIERVKALQPHIRSIVMTGYADLDVPIRAARIRADDYLHKPFELHSLLAAVGALLSKERPFRGLFSRLSEAANKAKRWIFDSRLSKLNDVRELCIKRFYLLIRSGRRTVKQVYPSFCRLERLELEYLKANQPQRWDQLAEDYLKLEELLLTNEVPDDTSPTLSLSSFRQLFEKIQQGRLESCHLQQAILLLHDPEARKRDLESYCTYHWLWSAPRQEQDAFVGLRVGTHVLERRRSSDNLRVRLYDACVPGHKEHGDVVLCLPVDQESALYLHQEIETGRCYLLDKLQAHYFLLYPGEALSLARRIPPQGFDPCAAWSVLRPVFQQVYLQHQQGRCCGAFGLGDVEMVANHPPRLLRFDGQAFRKQANDLQSGRLVGPGNAAPEAAGQVSPTPLSDQFVLGRMLFDAILGHSSSEFPTIYFQALGSQDVEPVWRAQAPKLGVLADCIYRLCQAEPDRRFSDLRQAALALDRATGR